ncbi:MAG: hypothetical protein KQH59_01200 [Desulfobulbaceae bacterium]|nr:hypothetical protein [Desulfobulbaceae bacterium]
MGQLNESGKIATPILSLAMTEQNQTPPPKRRVERNATAKFVIGLLFLIIAALGTIYVLFPESLDTFTAWTDRSKTIPSGQSPAESAEDRGQPEQDDRAADTSVATGADGSVRPSESLPSETSGRLSDTALPTIAPIGRTENEGRDQSAAEETSRETGCARLADPVENFFDTLDTRPYLHAFQLDERSSSYFPQLIQKLVDNPPVVTGETDDLFTILQNTAHFFRIIGKKNILVLKGILDRERDTFEQVLADFYQLTDYPDCLQQRFDLEIGDEPLYQYAGFFLNTMGGRLYLFRRDSMSRMVVVYYAILTIDQANREGRNKYGIDVGPAIDRLINEIESSNIDLRLRDRYLETLYGLEGKYQ